MVVDNPTGPYTQQQRSTRVPDQQTFTHARPSPSPGAAKLARKMRHSRRLSNHPTQPQGPFCSHCAVNLSPFPAYIRCADPACKNIPICVDCFSVGAADEVPHRPNHPYRVIEKLTQPIYASDWAAHEELRLLEALSEHGPHHWKPVADYVGKTQRKCEVHYENVYLKGHNTPLATSILDDSIPAASPAASGDGIETGDATEGKPGADVVERSGNERKLKNKDSEPGSGTMEGFMPLRGDFDVEWDDKAEELVSDLVIDHSDTPEEHDLKTRLLLMYNERLQRRNVVKEFLFDRKLLDFAELKYNDRRGTRDEKELSARLQVFSRLLSKPEFDAFYSSVMTEYRISRDVYRMAQARKAGMRTKAELDIYEVERKARYQHLGEQAKGKGKQGAVEKRGRSSAAADSPAPTATPLNSVPGTPGSAVMSPSKTAPPEGGATPDGNSEPHSVQVRKARERKRIARSPYPLLEAMPIDDMEDAWKLSQTEKKLCSALRIPPAEFLRMRDAMLYTASQNVKRRGRPRKRGSNTPVLTIRARRQSKDNGKAGKRRVTSKAQEAELMLNTVPLSAPHQQHVRLRQTNIPPAAESVPKVTLICKPPSNVTGVPIPTGLENSTLHEGEAAQDKLRLNLKVAPPAVQNLSNSPAMATTSTPAPTGSLVDSDDLPLSATFAMPSQQQRATPTPLTTGERKNDLENVPVDKRVHKGEGVEENPKEDSRDGTPESQVSCEEDIIHVTALDRARPVTRSVSRLSKQLRESVATYLTKVSQSSSALEGPKQADVESGPNRAVLKVTTLKVERPVTRSYAARMQSTSEDSNSQVNTPISESIDEEEELLDAAKEPRVDTVLKGHSTEFRVPRKRTHHGLSSTGIHDRQDLEEGLLTNAPIEESELAKSSKSPEDDVSSRDEVDEVLCGEDGAGDWPADTRERGQVEPEAVSHASTRGKSLGINSEDVANERHDCPPRNGSDAEELLDQGRASVDSTPGRTPQRLAKKQPKSPGRTSQRLAKKEPSTGDGTPQRLAKKQPRHLAHTDSPQKGKQDIAIKQTLEPKERDMESKETEVTIDGDGEYRGKREVPLTDRKARRSDDDSVEILSSGDGDYSESLGKNADEVEEVTLDEGQDDGVEDVRDATWTPQESDIGDGRQDRNDCTSHADDVSLENPACQTELGTEPGTPDTSFQEGEFRPCVESKEVADDRPRTRGTTHRREALPAVRKSSRVQKRSRRLEESVEAETQPVKRRRTNARGNLTGAARKSPANMTGTCTVITGQVGGTPLENLDDTEVEAGNVSKRFRPDTPPRSKRKSSRQNTPSKPRYPIGERRVTRSAGRQTRSRSASLRNRSVSDRLGLR